MRVLVLTNYFPPEIGGAAHLLYELAESFVQRGHEVTVVTGFPRYNVRATPSRYQRGLVMQEEIAGIRVLRIRVPAVPRTSLVLRGVEHLLAPTVLFAGALTRGRHDVVFTYSPPLPFGVAACVLGFLHRRPAVVSVQDLFPKEAVMLGLLKSRPLIRLFEALERFVYRRASRIVVHSPANRAHVLAHGGHPERTVVVSNWADTERIRPRERENGLRRRLGLTGRFVVSYAGTMGWCQDMTVVLEAARRLRAVPDVVFLLVGDGPDKPRAEERARALGLTNVVFLPTQDLDTYVEILAASDVSLINLNKNLKTPVVPSKLLNIMAAGRPVVASLPLDGDAPKIIAAAGCGVCVDAGDAVGLTEAIRTLYGDRDLARHMGQNGRTYAEREFSRAACVARFEALFESARGR